MKAELRGGGPASTSGKDFRDGTGVPEVFAPGQRFFTKKPAAAEGVFGSPAIDRPFRAAL